MYFKELEPEANEAINKKVQYRAYKRHEVVYLQGDQPRGIFVVKTGLVALMAVSNKGAEHLLRVFKVGDFFGHRAYFAGEVYHARTVCLEPSDIGLVAAEHVEEILERFPKSQRLIIKTLARDLGRAETLRVRVSDQEVVGRIAGAILYLKEVKPDHQWTRSEIAQFCASTGPTVIRTLAEFEKQNLISQRGRSIEIINRHELIELANCMK